MSLRTQRLLIRELQLSEMTQYRAVNNLLADAQTLAEQVQACCYAGALQLFVILKNQQGRRDLNVREGTVVSFIQILAEDRNGKSETSFRTHPSAQRYGFMQEALPVVFDYLLYEGGRHELFLETRADNFPVIGLMERLGLGHIQYPGWAWQVSGIASVIYEFGRYTWEQNRRR